MTPQAESSRSGSGPPSPGPEVVTPAGVKPLADVSNAAPTASGAAGPRVVTPAGAVAAEPDYGRRLRESAHEYVRGHSQSPAAGGYANVGPGPETGEGGHAGDAGSGHAPGRKGHGRSNGHPRGDNPAAAAFKSLPLYLKELASWAAYYLSAKSDGFKLTIRNLVIYAVLGLLGAIAGIALIVKAVTLTLEALSTGLAELFALITPGLAFLGPLLIGLLVLGGLALAVKIALSKVMGASRKQMELKYEGKRINQRVDFGRDVGERARQSHKRQHQEREQSREHAAP